MMMMRTSVHDHHDLDLDIDHDNHHRQFPISSSQRGEADGPSPTAASVTTTIQPLLPHRTNDIYGVDVASGFHHVLSGGSAPLQQLFFHTPSNISPSAWTAFKSPGGGNMATSVGFPFTNAQWKELERQAMIYKYMMASIPVPLDLLLPIATRSSSSSALIGNELKVRFAKARDPEPGRCKRTDGKKWRCSRDVAPDQKYCERHMHRGRPRSRKHVELHLNNNNNNNNNNNPHNKRIRHDQQNINSSATRRFASSNSSQSQPQPQTHFLGGVGGGEASTLLPYHPSPVFQPVPPSTDKEQRSLEWMMMMKGGGGGEEVAMAASDPRWLHLMQQTKLEMTTKPSSSPIFTQEEPFLNLNSYANFTAGEDDDHHGRDCALYLNPDDVVSLQNQTSSGPRPPPPPQRSFIDAWSSQTQDRNRSSPSSTLSLSMGGQTQIMSHANDDDDDDKNKSCSCPFPSCSWGVGSSSLGGPLGEVLRPSAASDPPSPFTGNGDSGSPPATVVLMSSSSPSGVLQKTLAAASLSDSSGCSSPALGSSKSKPETSLL